MSKTINSLKELQNKRNGKYTLALDKAVNDTKHSIEGQDELTTPICPAPSTEHTQRNTQYRMKKNTQYIQPHTQYKKNKMPWIAKLAIAIFVLFLLGLNFRLFLKLNQIEEIVNNNTQLTSTIYTDTRRLSTDTKAIYSKITDIKANIKKIDEANAVQIKVIGDLKQDKNNLFNKLSSLEKKINDTSNTQASEIGNINKANNALLERMNSLNIEIDKIKSTKVDNK